MTPSQLEAGLRAVLDACDGNGRYIRLALAELGLRYAEDCDDLEFLAARVTALRQEDILYREEGS